MEPRKELHPLKIEGALKADGHLDEEEWIKAPAVNLAFQVEPFQGRKASFNSTVKLLYNHQFLYLAAIMKDSTGRTVTVHLI